MARTRQLKINNDVDQLSLIAICLSLIFVFYVKLFCFMRLFLKDFGLNSLEL